MNSLFIYIIGISILAYVYISYYYRYPTNVKILNAYEQHFNTTLMLEKQPIVILNNTLSLIDFKKKTVPYLITKNLAHSPYFWNRNPTKYLFIQSREETEIHLLQPSKKLTDENIPDINETLITLQIKPTQIIILPFHWYYYSDFELNLLGVHDYISWALP